MKNARTFVPAVSSLQCCSAFNLMGVISHKTDNNLIIVKLFQEHLNMTSWWKVLFWFEVFGTEYG